MSTEIYIIRHGETIWNKDGVVQGHMNSILSEKGIKQAKSVAERLKKYHFDVIYSSDLIRAMDTANYINEYHNKVIIVDETLRERSLGVLEGKAWPVIKKDHVKAANVFFDGKNDEQIPGGGESKIQFANRIKSFMDRLIIQEEGKRILIITHGCLINFWMKIVLGVPYEDKNKLSYVENGKINKFSYKKGKWTLEKFNA